MRTDSVFVAMTRALGLQKKLLADLEKQTYTAEGYLIVRKSGAHKLYYQGVKVKTPLGWRTKANNISNHLELVQELAKKGLGKKQKSIYRKNIKTLEVALGKYIPLTNDVLMPEQYREVLAENGKIPKTLQVQFDANKHIHATVCGVMVRSKGEAIIANALWHYGIPFIYEEMFPHQSEEGDWYYPDFTIHLPNGEIIIWEHWGLLDRKTYCFSNAGKLHTYNANGFVIGKNLIITQDDAEGGCDSAHIYHIIETYIAPYFSGDLWH